MRIFGPILSRIMICLCSVYCCFANSDKDIFISRYAAAVVPHRVLVVPLVEAGMVEFCHDGEGRVARDTLLVRVNEKELALEEAELRNQQRQNRVKAEENLLQLRRKKEELEFIMAQPDSRRKFMEARFRAQADERALELLAEQIAVQEAQVKLANEKLQQAFDKRSEPRRLRMPFDGRVQYHMTPGTGEEREVRITQTGPLLSVMDDSRMYIAISPGEAEVVKLPPQRLKARLDLGGGQYLEGAWSHNRVEMRNNKETLVYFFALPDEVRESACAMVGANTVGELLYCAGENEQLLNLHKMELVRKAGEQPFETWEELVKTLYPGYEIVFTGETHICLRRTEK